MARVLLTGGSGRLGTALRRELLKQEIPFLAPASAKCDVRKDSHCQRAIDEYDPDIIIHAAACANAELCELDYEHAWAVNYSGTENMALASYDHPRFVLISTDYVFNGKKGNYTETDVPCPVNVYGITKMAAEVFVRWHPNTLIVRAPFRADGPWPYQKAFTDQWTSCRFVSQVAPDIVKAALMRDLTGIIHIGGPRRSIYDLAREASPEVGQMTRADFPGLRIPRDTSLNSSKWHSILAASTQSSQLAAIST